MSISSKPYHFIDMHYIDIVKESYLLCPLLFCVVLKTPLMYCGRKLHELVNKTQSYMSSMCKMKVVTTFMR